MFLRYNIIYFYYDSYLYYYSTILIYMLILVAVISITSVVLTVTQSIGSSHGKPRYTGTARTFRRGTRIRTPGDCIEYYASTIRCSSSDSSGE